MFLLVPTQWFFFFFFLTFFFITFLSTEVTKESAVIALNQPTQSLIAVFSGHVIKCVGDQCIEDSPASSCNVYHKIFLLFGHFLHYNV